MESLRQSTVPHSDMAFSNGSRNRPGEERKTSPEQTGQQAVNAMTRCEELLNLVHCKRLVAEIVGHIDNCPTCQELMKTL